MATVAGGGGHADRRGNRTVQQPCPAAGDQQRREVPGRDQPQPPAAQVQFTEQHRGELVVAVDVQQAAQPGQDGLDVVALGDNSARTAKRSAAIVVAAGSPRPETSPTTNTMQPGRCSMTSYQSPPTSQLVDAGHVAGGDLEPFDGGNLGQQRVLQRPGDAPLLPEQQLVAAASRSATARRRERISTTAPQLAARTTPTPSTIHGSGGQRAGQRSG